ncbi:MAG: LicD family protein [Alistipes sp.]|nr:LicD family protein [Alistipes sp.]
MTLTELIKKTYVYRVYHTHMLKKEAEYKIKRLHWFREEGEEMLNNFSKTLNDSGITYWLEFGTLLGYHREHDFIKHDYDLDFGAFIKDAERIRHSLTKDGFQLVHSFNASDGGLEECYKYKHTTLDIFYFREDEYGLYCNSFSPCLYSIKEKLSRKRKCYVKKIYIPGKEFKKVEYKGCIVGVPVNIIEHLRMHYGKSFMIPNPNFDYKKEATNITYYDLSEVHGYVIIHGQK